MTGRYPNHALRTRVRPDRSKLPSYGSVQYIHTYINTYIYHHLLFHVKEGQLYGQTSSYLNSCFVTFNPSAKLCVCSDWRSFDSAP